MTHADTWETLKSLTAEQQRGVLSYLMTAYGDELAEAVEYARLTWPSDAVSRQTANLPTSGKAAAEETVFDWATEVPELALPSDLRERAASAFFFDLLADRLPTIRAVKERLKLGQDRATLVRTYLAQLATA